MAIDLQEIINSSFGVSLVYILGRVLPPWLGHSIADFTADRIASRRDSKIVRAVRANQWVVRGEALERDDLNPAVGETFRHSARSIFDLYHYIQNPEAVKRLIVLDPAARQLIRRPEFDDRGLMVVGLHLGNFDLALQGLCLLGMRPLVLTIPDVHGGRRLEFELRKKTGANMVPASVGALRQALRHLQRGGLVATGIDRPIPKPKVHPRFFGRPASLPMDHIFLAIKAQVPVLVLAANMQPDGKTLVFASDPIAMDPHPDRKTEVLRNAEKVLTVVERYIRQAPEQWSVSLPVWPEILGLVPN